MKIISKPVLLASTLPLIIASFSSCSKYTPGPKPQAGATQGSTSGDSLDGYWIEESVPAGQKDALKHPPKPSSILIQNRKFFNLVKYSDGTVDKMDAGYSVPTSADSNGNFVIPGPGYVETITFRGDELLVNDAETQNGVTTKIEYVYIKGDQDTASQHARQLWFKQKSTYDYATQYCAPKNKLNADEAAMVGEINQFVDNDLKNSGTTLDQIRALRNGSAGTLNNCQIAEDYLERGIDYAKTGVTPLYPELAPLPSLQLTIDSKTSLAPITSLQINSLTLMSDGVSVIDLTPIAKVMSLESLNLQDMKASGFEKLSALSNLENLTLTTTDLSDYSSLNKFPDLMGITLTNSSIANALDTISSINQLDSLTLVSTGDISKKIDISSLGKLAHLTSLSLTNAFFADLKFLPLLSKLTHLDVALESDDFVDMIASLSTINKLNVGIEKTVKDAGDLTFVAKIPNITGLNLTLSSGFQDLSEISEINTPKLKSLVLQAAAGEPTQTLPDLSGLAKITSLNLITADSFSIADLKPLEGLLKADTNLSLSLQMDRAKSNQKGEDQALQTEFGKRYQSSLTFN
jgi:hypothetical protein